MTVPLVQSAGRRWLTIGCALTIVCLIMLPVALLDLKSAGLPRQWREARGIIDSATVGSTTSNSGRLGVDAAYVPDVRYRYTVDGREFRGDTVHRGLAANSEEEARATVERYPAGAGVSVFYNPDAPEQAVLERDIRPQTYQAALATAAGLLAGIACLFRFRKLRRQELGLDAAAPSRRKYRETPPRSRRKPRR